MPDWKKYAFEVNNKKRNLKLQNATNAADRLLPNRDTILYNSCQPLLILFLSLAGSLVLKKVFLK
jgi:hypothetical protein